MQHAKLSASIIVPMYRSKDTIQRALASIMMNQAIDGEIIVIDDGSNDDGLLVAYDYLQNKNPYHYSFRLVSNLQNQGAYYSRNLGVRLASKSYILFLDADDEFTTDCFEILTQQMMIRPVDLLFYDLILRQNGANDVTMRSVNSDDVELIDYVKALPSPCNKLIKRQLFIAHDITFPNTIYEDLATSYRLVLAARSIDYIRRPLYIYHKATSGNVSSIVDERIVQLYDVIEQMSNDLEQSAQSFDRDKWMDFAVSALFNQYLMVIALDDHHLVKRFYKRIIKFLDEQFGKQWNDACFFHPSNLRLRVIRSMLKSMWSYRILNRISFVRNYIKTHFHF